ncbi:hypothetical protein tb265_12430 [Gemmatimonadetes bacterium T265]|nr:hypothetical protein tb265_12430 [Gemmatimonadetes bacterium T265]
MMRATLPNWTLWLQNGANFAKLIELGAFVFSAYQFWAGRRERRAADAASADRARIDATYQAWQVINSAQGKGGSGGRIEALADLLRHDVSLAGVRLDDAWLEDVRLPGARLVRSSFRRANLARANFAGADLEGADFTGADLVSADLTNTNLRGATLAAARLSAATLDGADLRDVKGWTEVRSYAYASVAAVRNPPTGFTEFAHHAGAVGPGRAEHAADDERNYSRVFRAV